MDEVIPNGFSSIPNPLFRETHFLDFSLFFFIFLKFQKGKFFFYTRHWHFQTGRLSGSISSHFLHGSLGFQGNSNSIGKLETLLSHPSNKMLWWVIILQKIPLKVFESIIFYFIFFFLSIYSLVQILIFLKNLQYNIKIHIFLDGIY